MGPNSPNAPARVPSSVIWKLSAMMALVYAAQGAWWPLLAVHLQDLGLTSRQIGRIFGAAALGALAAPLAGMIADRLMPIQRLLSLIFALGTGFLVVFASGVVTGPMALFVLFLGYWLLLAPRDGLSGALALRNLPRPSEQFGRVRLWGTIGWMTIGWVVSQVIVSSGGRQAGRGVYEAFWVAAALSAAVSIFCLFLPDTPPLATRERGRIDLAGAFEVARKPAVAIYLAVAFGVSLTTPFLYQVLPPYLELLGLPREWTAPAMTLGQVPEILALAIMPWILGRLGYKGTLALGIAALAVRYGTLAVGAPLWVAVAGIPLHGVGQACFMIAGLMFLDDQAPFDRRAGAQVLSTTITYGIGSLLGNVLAGEVVGWSAGRPALAFVFPTAINAAMLVTFTLAFRPEGSRAKPMVAVEGVA